MLRMVKKTNSCYVYFTTSPNGKSECVSFACLFLFLEPLSRFSCVDGASAGGPHCTAAQMQYTCTLKGSCSAVCFCFCVFYEPHKKGFASRQPHAHWNLLPWNGKLFYHSMRRTFCTCSLKCCKPQCNQQTMVEAKEITLEQTVWGTVHSQFCRRCLARYSVSCIVKGSNTDSSSKENEFVKCGLNDQGVHKQSNPWRK